MCGGRCGPTPLPCRAARSLWRGGERSLVQKDVCVFYCCNFFTKFPVMTQYESVGCMRNGIPVLWYCGPRGVPHVNSSVKISKN
jgi:hypothetical protein